MWSFWSPPPFLILFSQILNHLIIAAMPAHVLEAGANVRRRWCRFPLVKGHDVPHVWSSNIGPLFIGLWLFSIFPFFHLFRLVHIFGGGFYTFPHFDQFGRLYLFFPIQFFFFVFIWFPILFCHTQFFTPFSTPVPFFSVMLISFILLAFPSSSFLCIWLLEFAIACCLYLFVPFEEKLDLSTRWVVFFSHYFSLFPPLDVESLSLAFYLFTLFL